MPKQTPNPNNIEGDWFCTDPEAPENGCILCQLCYSSFENIFASTPEGAAFVHRQPVTQAEKDDAAAAAEMCPVHSIIDSSKE